MRMIYRYVGSQVILASVEMTKQIKQPGLPLNLTTEKKFKIPHTDFKMKINKYILQQRLER